MGEGTQPPVVSTSDRGVGDIVLMRAGHYFNAGNGGCQGATVAHVFSQANDEHPALVNLSVLQQDGSAVSRTSVPVAVAPSTDDTSNSFHLTRDCPWGR